LAGDDGEQLDEDEEELVEKAGDPSLSLSWWWLLLRWLWRRRCSFDEPDDDDTASATCGGGGLAVKPV